ncbi:aspartic peptidase domain-containing protein [Halteromyces radiatus]|uniref:aspartic peptidase domain-containing protein n=1 Tax=Halteromyces radiatus TaxID=101107 RepID=UPI002221272F|nr:aspartic peptidase domain-containing protein [Halteromyces radiatus]KAI8082869.1 aspartic peptidase domain-containing protein [Halteromyces radiatus]
MLDTGSSVLWVPSSACDEKNCPGSSTSTLFDSSQSSSYIGDKNNRFFMDYGVGHCIGESGQDSVFIGVKEIEHQKFGVANKISKDLLVDGVNGVFGLGPPVTTQVFNQNKEKWKTPLEQLFANKAIDRNMFSIYLDDIDNIEEFESANGQLTLGDLPPRDSYSGDIQWAPLLGGNLLQYYWAIKSNGIKLDNEYISGDLIGIVDTGTTMIILAPEYGNRVIESLKITEFDEEKRLYTVDCNKVRSLPTLTFMITDGVTLVLTPEQYTVPHWQTTLWQNNDARCPLYISTDSSDKFDFVFGQKFLEHYVTIYDVDNKQIGFAPSVHNKASK